MKLLRTITAFALLSGTTAFSQTAGGVSGLTGVVLDSSGAVVANAEVLVDNPRLGIHRKLATTAGGVFNAPALVPSSGYQVTINAAGFARYQTRDITILVGQDLNIRAELQIASASTQVEVQGEASAVEIKTDVSQNVTQRQIDNLPINGRRVDSFALLTPGVAPDGNSGLLSFEAFRVATTS